MKKMRAKLHYINQFTGIWKLVTDSLLVIREGLAICQETGKKPGEKRWLMPKYR
jgi:hypothetical protein